MMPVTRVDRSRTDRNHDEAMGAQVLRRLTEADRNTFRAVSVQAWDNRVVLIGAVVKPLQRRRAEAIARTVEGVGIVDNEIILAEDKALAVFVPDAARERQLQGRLAGTASLGGAYGVRVANGVAFIVGTVGSADELDRLKSVVLDTDGIKWMVPHITVAGR
jgi:osmotically-inducible protein OsmY